MHPLALLSPSVALSVDGVALSDSTVTLLLRTIAATADCPLCGQPSRYVHSRYVRHASDLPWQGRQAALALASRRFFCKNQDCPRAVFCERLPELVLSRARVTTRLTRA